MRISVSWPTSRHFGGGVAALFSYADGLARRGHEVHVVHGPRSPDRISHVDEIDWFTFHPSIEHHIVDDLHGPDMPVVDVCFGAAEPGPKGLPAALIQGHGLIAAALERPAFRARCPKICVADWLRVVGTEWGSPPEQMFHVPPGFDHSVFHPPPPGRERPIDVAMLYSIHPTKGGEEGRAALEGLRAHRPDLRVELFGMIRPEGDVPSWATYRTAPDQATLADEVYGRAKVFLQPSRREGFGLTAVEAMACGAALVTTDNGGSRDYAHHDTTAEVVPVGDPAAMADAVERLLDDPDRRSRLAAAGERLARVFTWERAAEDLETILEAYLDDPDRFRAPPRDAPMFVDDEKVLAEHRPPSMPSAAAS